MCGGGGGGGGERTGCGRLACVETKQFARLSNEVKYEKSNYIHNVEHVVQSTFQNMLTTF